MYIIPEPKKMEEKNGCFLFPYQGRIVMRSGDAVDLYREAEFLQQKFAEYTGLVLELARALQPEGAVVLSVDHVYGRESYKLDVSQAGIVITGGSGAGVLYGIQTLLQIVRQYGLALPGVTIEDQPSLAVRGFYHDVTRSRIPTMEQLKKTADLCSSYKLNQLQLYIEHTFMFQNFTEVWRDDTPLTAEDILIFDKYCQDRHIELVPSVASFGHLYKVLRTKSYRKLGEFEEQADRSFSFVERMAHHTLDITQEASLELVREMLAEFVPLFSSDKFNLCADETFDLGKGKTKKHAEVYGSTAMYIAFVNKLCELVKGYGKQPMIWGDILLSMPEQIHELPSDLICLNWDYAHEPSETNVRQMAELGVRQYLCPGVHGWKHMINRLDLAWQNISAMCCYAHKYGTEGILNTDWGDFGHIHHPDFSVPGLIYGAALSWSDKEIEEDELNRQISVVEYGDKSGSFVDNVKELAEQEAFGWDQFVFFMEGYEVEYQSEMDNRSKFETAEQANAVIQNSIKKLCARMKDMDLGQRNRIIPYLIMAEGQMLLNKAGSVVRQGDAYSGQAGELAADIERWTKDYRQLWMQTSRVSELHQVLNLFFRFADYLREHNC